ncbi:MAG: OmpH family outer membrane protein [Bacteroidota bacterium]|nr:OmpH family outer membrane protein [Bacteroidota bacterium]
MKRGLLILVLAVVALNVNAQTKIAHINSQVLLDTLQSRKDAMAKLKKFEEEGVLELQEMNKSFEAAVMRYQQNEKDWSPVIKQMEEEKLQKKQVALQTRQQELEQQMQIYGQELNKPILELVQTAVNNVAEGKKLSYVLDETVTLYFKGGIDITNEVMTELLKLEKELLGK